MSIKDLFEKQKQNSISLKVFSESTIDQFSDEVESSEYLEQKQIYAQTLIPDLDYSSASNFVRFGSAEKYYQNSIDRITGQYPYDGSKAEQLEFYNSLNPLEKYLFNNEYPRSTGYVNFAPNGWSGTSTQTLGYGSSSSPEYIYFYNQSVSNVYSPDNSRRENVRFIFSSGSTVEFWMKKNAFPNITTETQRESIFYATTTDTTRRFIIHTNQGASTSSIYSTYYIYDPNTLTVTQDFLFAYDTGLSTIADSNWHHYALTFYSSSAGYTSELYVDGVYKTTQTDSSTVIDFTGSAKCTIGALGGYISTTDLTGYGKLSGSIDEFRFWNTRRNAKQIGTNYFTHVGGGTNTDLANVDLGVYYKFNEGITLTSSVDSTVLDYAGRVCNGTFVGYSSASRSTGSAIDEATTSEEPQDPIIYVNNPLLSAYSAEKALSGSSYDASNNGNLVNSMPDWILEEDSTSGNVLSNFLQSIASYLDTLYLQVSNINKLKNISYEQNGGKQNPFNNKLLTSLGFDTPDLFINSDILKSIFDQDDKRLYEEKIDDIKNQIYKNIYNNLIYINKSKGTEKAFRNLVRCFGADDSLFKLTIYANNTDYQLKDKYTEVGVKKSYLDMTEVVSASNSQAIVYQYADPTNVNSAGFITASTNYNIGVTLETELVFPNISPTYNKPFLKTPSTYTSQSLFGIREANSSNQNDTTFQSPDRSNVQVYSVYRDDLAYFVITSSLGFYGETNAIKNVYNDTRWNISFRLKPNGYPFVSGAFATSSYIAEFYGYNYDSGELLNSFTSSFTVSSSSAKNFYDAAKRVYVGANRTNITGSVINSTNIKPLSVRYWSDYLDSEEIKIHARDIRNYGRNKPGENSFVYEEINSYIPRIDTLSLFWDFETLSISDATGSVSNIPDIKSSSISSSAYPSSINNLIKYQHTAKGSYFAENYQVRKADYFNSSRIQIPENLDSSELIQILEADDEKITAQTLPQSLFFSVESSMYDVISRKALEFFSTIANFNNLIGEPTNKFKTSYKDLTKLRQLFFENVENSPDLEKYVELYKWVDDALEGVLANLIPASANASDKVRTIVENHILERNKARQNILVNTKVPSVTDKDIGNQDITPLTPKIDGDSNNQPWTSPYSGTNNGAIDLFVPIGSPTIPSANNKNSRDLINNKDFIEKEYVFKPYIDPPNGNQDRIGINTKALYRFSRQDTNLLPDVQNRTNSEQIRIVSKNIPRIELGRVLKFSNNSVDIMISPGTTGLYGEVSPQINPFAVMSYLNTTSPTSIITMTPDPKQVFLPDNNLSQQVDFFQDDDI